MPTPKTGYFVNGTRVPGTTTIIGRFKDSAALIYWAWDQGRQGKDFRETTQHAADAGTLAHRMVECDLKGIPFSVEDWYERETIRKAQSSFAAYKSWKNQTKLKVESLEIPMTSSEFMFGGTPDAVCWIDGKLSLMDIKTSSGIYRDHLIQVAAYGFLWNSNNPSLNIAGGYHILRFSREDGDFSHHFFPELNDGWEMFKVLRKAYDLDLKLKKRAG